MAKVRKFHVSVLKMYPRGKLFSDIAYSTFISYVQNVMEYDNVS
jgi:hypothetical protein